MSMQTSLGMNPYEPMGMKTDGVEPSRKIQYAEWQQQYEEALLELDMDRLKERIAAAEIAILNRRESLNDRANHHAERYAMEDALAALRVLKREIGAQA